MVTPYSPERLRAAAALHMFEHLKTFLADSWSGFKRTFWTFFGFLMSQVGIQAMNFFTGFMIIRAMVKDDYAAYTIVNTLMPTMIILSDNGIGNGMFAIGRVVWEDDEKLGSLVTTGLTLRRRFALFSFMVAGPFLVWMLFKNHVPVSTIAWLMLLALTAISLQLTGSVYKMVPQLRQQIKTMSVMGLLSTLTRLVLTAFCVFVLKDISSVAAVAAATLGTVLETYLAFRSAKPQIKWNAPFNTEYRSTMYGLVRKTLPFTIYFCIQSQISIWLIGIFGSSHQVADIGAAARLGIIYTTVTSSFSAIMVVRFARANGRKKLYTGMTQIILGLAASLAGLVAVAYFCPWPFVWLLGHQYYNMAGLMWLVILAFGSNSLAGSMYGLNACKGWIPPAYISIPVEIVSQIALLCILDVSKTANVLIFACLASIPIGIVNVTLLVRRIAKETEP